jgi:anti-sigma factor RsiW
MECNKWEETGFLYMSNELDESKRAEFDDHLLACPSCKTEKDLYSYEKQHLFTRQHLCEPTPEHLDKKIIALCARPMVPTGLGLFSFAVMKKVVFSLIVFSLGIGAGGYFTFVYYNARTNAPYAQTRKAPGVQAAPATQVAATGVSADAARLTPDSVKSTGVPLPAKNLRTPLKKGQSQGIIVVDLKKEQ